MNRDDIKNLYDVVIVGGGPSGLTAALYLARACYRVLVVEKENFGGQITITSEVVNYPGVPRTSGAELTDNMRKQAESFGAEFLFDEVLSLDLSGDIKTVKTASRELSCFGVLIATGAHPRKIGFKGEDEFKGHGVAYCATCDGEFFRDKQVFVIGGGFAAAEESVFLTKYASHVTVLMRGNDFSCAKSVADETKAHPKISVHVNSVVEEVSGDTLLRKMVYKNTKTGEITEYEAAPGETFGVFSFAGYVPATSLVEGLIELNEQKYIVTDRNQKTSLDGVYAAGDVCIKNLRQVVTAVSDGAIAATELEKHVSAMSAKTGLVTEKPCALKAAQKAEASEAQTAGSDSALFTADMLNQLNAVFEKMANPLILKVYTKGNPVSTELVGYMTELTSLTDKLSLEVIESNDEDAPMVSVFRADGSPVGISFHGVPGGHEFTSFVLGLYNAAGPGQAIDPDVKDRLAKISQPTEIKVIVSLSCTMCPETVIAAQRAAIENPLITADVFDMAHFPELAQKYQAMSVPCIVVNEDKTSFGKKNINQMLELLEQ